MKNAVVAKMAVSVVHVAHVVATNMIAANKCLARLKKNTGYLPLHSLSAPFPG